MIFDEGIDEPMTTDDDESGDEAAEGGEDMA